MNTFDKYRGTLYCTEQESDVLDEEYEEAYKKVKSYMMKLKMQGIKQEPTYDELLRAIPEIKKETVDKMIYEDIIGKNPQNGRLTLLLITDKNLFSKPKFEKYVEEIVEYVKTNEDGRTSMNDLFLKFKDIKPRYIKRMIEYGILEYSKTNNGISVTEKGFKEAAKHIKSENEAAREEFRRKMREYNENHHESNFKNDEKSKLVEDIKKRYGFDPSKKGKKLDDDGGRD